VASYVFRTAGAIASTLRLNLPRTDGD